MMRYLTIALTKGRLAKQTMKLLEQIGISCEEMNEMTGNLFACKHHNFTADGKTIIHILNYEDVNSWFK